MRLEILKSRIDWLSDQLKAPEQDLGPWPPQEGSFSHCLWQDLGHPVERIGFMDMYMQKAAQVWGEADAV
jgi:hypothetical protein